MLLWDISHHDAKDVAIMVRPLDNSQDSLILTAVLESALLLVLLSKLLVLARG